MNASDLTNIYETQENTTNKKWKNAGTWVRYEIEASSDVEPDEGNVGGISISCEDDKSGVKNFPSRRSRSTPKKKIFSELRITLHPILRKSLFNAQLETLRSSLIDRGARIVPSYCRPDYIIIPPVKDESDWADIKDSLVPPPFFQKNPAVLDVKIEESRDRIEPLFVHPDWVKHCIVAGKILGAKKKWQGCLLIPPSHMFALQAKPSQNSAKVKPTGIYDSGSELSSEDEFAPVMRAKKSGKPRKSWNNTSAASSTAVLPQTKSACVASSLIPQSSTVAVAKLTLIKAQEAGTSFDTPIELTDDSSSNEGDQESSDDTILLKKRRKIDVKGNGMEVPARPSTSAPKSAIPMPKPIPSLKGKEKALDEIGPLSSTLSSQAKKSYPPISTSSSSQPPKSKKSLSNSQNLAQKFSNKTSKSGNVWKLGSKKTSPVKEKKRSFQLGASSFHRVISPMNGLYFTKKSTAASLPSTNTSTTGSSQNLGQASSSNSKLAGNESTPTQNSLPGPLYPTNSSSIYSKKPSSSSKMVLDDNSAIVQFSSTHLPSPASSEDTTTPINIRERKLFERAEEGIPFWLQPDGSNRAQLKMKILLNGGIVVDEPSRADVVLLDCPGLTYPKLDHCREIVKNALYIACLSDQWVLDCISKNRILPYDFYQIRRKPQEYSKEMDMIDETEDEKFDHVEQPAPLDAAMNVVPTSDGKADDKDTIMKDSTQLSSSSDSDIEIIDVPPPLSKPKTSHSFSLSASSSSKATITSDLVPAPSSFSRLPSSHSALLKKATSLTSLRADPIPCSSPPKQDSPAPSQTMKDQKEKRSNKKVVSDYKRMSGRSAIFREGRDDGECCVWMAKKLTDWKTDDPMVTMIFWGTLGLERTRRSAVGWKHFYQHYQTKVDDLVLRLKDGEQIDILKSESNPLINVKNLASFPNCPPFEAPLGSSSTSSWWAEEERMVLWYFVKYGAQELPLQIGQRIQEKFPHRTATDFAARYTEHLYPRYSDDILEGQAWLVTEGHALLHVSPSKITFALTDTGAPAVEGESWKEQLESRIPEQEEPEEWDMTFAPLKDLAAEKEWLVEDPLKKGAAYSDKEVERLVKYFIEERAAEEDWVKEEVINNFFKIYPEYGNIRKPASVITYIKRRLNWFREQVSKGKTPADQQHVTVKREQEAPESIPKAEGPVSASSNQQHLSSTNSNISPPAKRRKANAIRSPIQHIAAGSSGSAEMPISVD